MIELVGGRGISYTAQRIAEIRLVLREIARCSVGALKKIRFRSSAEPLD